MLPALTAALFAATIAVRTGEIAGVEPELAHALAGELARAIERHTGDRVVFDTEVGRCAGAECLAALRARIPCDEAVVFDFFGGLTRVRILAERASFAASPLPVRQDRIESEGPRDAEAWWDRSAEVARRLFPERISRAAPQPAAAVVLPPERGIDPVPWIFAGGAGAALVTGAIFAASSLDARSALGEGDRTSAELAVLEKRQRDHAIAAGVLAGAAAGLAVAGALLAD